MDEADKYFDDVVSFDGLEYIRGGNTYKEVTRAFRAGQTAERERLLNLAPEFDPNEADPSADFYGAFVSGARWQHAQLSPVIGALREENAELRGKLADHNRAAEHRKLVVDLFRKKQEEQGTRCYCQDHLLQMWEDNSVICWECEWRKETDKLTADRARAKKMVEAAADTIGMYRRIYDEDPKVNAVGLNGALVNLMQALADYEKTEAEGK